MLIPQLYAFFHFGNFIYLLPLAVQSPCWLPDFSLVAPSGGSSPVAVRRGLTVLASLAAEPGLRHRGFLQ